VKVLLVKLSSLGDIVHTFPAVSEALARRPGTLIDWLVDRPYVDLVRLHDGVRKAIPNDALRPGPREATTERAAEAVVRTDYDIVIDAQGLFRSAILSRRWHAPVLGADGRSVREWPAHLLYHRRVSVPRSLHASDATRLLMGAALDYEAEPLLRPSPDLPARDGPGSRSANAMLLHGTKQRCKEWPFEHWVEVARHVADRGLVPTVTWGDAREEEFCRRLAAAVPAVRIVARLQFAELVALIDDAALVVTVDTGLGHLADWRGCRTIMLFQASDPYRLGPSGHASRALWVGDPPKRTRGRDRDRPPQHPVVPPDLVKRAIYDGLARSVGQ
jgi:heptosyltransferase-1